MKNSHNNMIFSRYMRDYMRDERGALMIFAAIGIFLLFIGVFALSIDTGISYKDQSNIEAKLANCANYAASEYTYWKIRKATGASDRPNDNLVLPKTNMEEGAVLKLLGAYVQDCVRAGELNELKDAKVPAGRIEYNSVNQAILVFDATTPQNSTFSGKGKDHAVVKTQSGKLVPFYTGSTPPEVSEEQQLKMAAMVVFPLNYNGMKNIGQGLEAFTAKAKEAFATLQMVGLDGLRVGMQTGNIPADQPEPISNRQVQEIGWSGGMLDDNASMLAGSGHGNSATIRSWPFVASVYAPNTRRCDSNPVWTYERVDAPQKTCYEWREQGSVSVCDSDNAAAHRAYNNAIQACIRDPRHCYIGRNNRSCEEHEDCPTKKNPNKKCCISWCETTWFERKLKGGDVYQGKWSISCPKNVRDTGHTYKEPKDYLKWTAYLVANLDGTPVSAAQQVKLEGSMEKIKLSGVQHQTGEFSPLVKKNTDKSWNWACGWMANGLKGGATGAYGHPHGDAAGRPLVSGTSNSTAAANTLGCQLGAPPGGNGSAYKITFARPGCATPEEPVGKVNCNMPEGYYQIRVAVTGLKRTMTVSDVVPGRPNPPVTASVGPNGPWAWGGVGGEKQYGNLQPGGKGDDGKGYTGYGASPGGNDTDKWGDLMCNNPNGGYLTAYAWSQDIIPTNVIPAEYMKLSDVAVESYRNAEEPGMSPLDLFDAIPSDTSSPGNGVKGEDYVVITAADGYPFFPEAGSSALRETNAFASGTGIAAFNGDQVSVGERAVGVIPISEGERVKPIQATGMTMQITSNAISNLETVKKKDENFTAENIPVAMDSLDSVLDQLTYNAYTIHTGHGGNEGPLMNAGLYRLLGAAKADDRTALIYVGSCPTAGAYGSDASTSFQGHKVNWFANSNAGTEGPGQVDETTLKLMDARNPGGDVRSMTKQVFSKVKGAVDYFMVITNESTGCKDFADLSTEGAISGDLIGNSGCVIGNSSGGYTVTPEDCAAEFIWAIMGERQEVRKKNM
ncbi:MAG: hypothetical protein IT567_04180 [Alphaproteobacteria bacterium]|nr:hypothetical protein [Alphaproteobacteria bacterium]